MVTDSPIQSPNPITRLPDYSITRVSLEDFIDEEDVGEQCPDVDVRIEVVDDRRADRWLRQHHLQRRVRAARIAIDDLDERAVDGGVEIQAGDVVGEERAE